MESWEFIVVSDGHLVILSSGASARIIVISVVRDQLPEHWITAEWYNRAVKFSSSGAPHVWGWASGGVIEGVWASDRSAGVMRQVRRCKAEQDDGMINPATPQVQRERLRSPPRRLWSEEVTEGSAKTSKPKNTQVTDSLMLLMYVSHSNFTSNGICNAWWCLKFKGKFWFITICVLVLY